MGVKNNHSHIYPNADNLRKAVSFWHALSELIGGCQPLTGAESTFDICGLMKERIGRSSDGVSVWNHKKIEKASAENYFVPEERFEWLKNDERVCYWLWVKVTKFCKELPLFGGRKDGIYIYQSWGGLPNNPTSHQERYDALVQYLDLIPERASEKLSWIDNVKSQWLWGVNHHEDFRWIQPITEESADWVWDYVSSNRAIPPTVKASFCPFDRNEKFRAAIGIVDSWVPTKDAFDLFIFKMKKAWSQKKFRDKQGDRKQYSFSLKPQSRELLKQQASRHNCKANELIELLIDKSLQDELLVKSEDERILELFHIRHELAQAKAELKFLEKENDQLAQQLKEAVSKMSDFL